MSPDEDTANPEKTGTDAVPSVDVGSMDASSVDFLQIRGIGPVAAERLIAEGVTSFDALAELSAKEIGFILSWSPDRVQKAEIISQARELAAKS